MTRVQNLIQELEKLNDTLESFSEAMRLIIAQYENNCPFDPIAKCNLKHGDSCAEVDCPVWLSVGEKINGSHL